ncbi:MAG: carboxymuconolactone decarboxylase family protein [Gammaproteobacteria bacterium]|nr:carboxymuconolactone decarboxylase family protein [Gammaproteobacteria bacterium]
MDVFRKRIFTFSGLLAASYGLIKSIPGVLWVYLLRGLAPGFAERILLVVSGVNACSYCCWFHAKMAERSGLDSAEVDSLLQQLIPQGSAESEKPALIFALHYAESGARPEPAQLELLMAHYSPMQVFAIRSLCAAIYFGNLSGNTFDAFLQRFRGNPVAGSHWPVELILFLICAPFLLPIMHRVAKR